MRKFATFAALALSAGTAVAGGASVADADVNLGVDAPTTSTAPAAGSMDFASTWCGAPWLWSGHRPARAVTLRGIRGRLGAAARALRVLAAVCAKRVRKSAPSQQPGTR